MCLIEPNGNKKEFIGQVEGVIPLSPMGAGGFGFDPIFYIPEENKTLGQMTFEEKEKYSDSEYNYMDAEDVLLSISLDIPQQKPWKEEERAQIEKYAESFFPVVNLLVYN